jgi:Rieske Fe-S protein
MTFPRRGKDDRPAAVVDPGVTQISPLTPEQQRTVASRRKFLQWTVGGSLAAIGAAFAFPVLAIRSVSQYTDVATEGDVIGDPGTGNPLDLSAFTVGMGAYTGIVGKSTQNNANLLEVVRVAENGDAGDFRVYNRICTHLGCPVTPTLNEAGHIWCGCHGSNFSTEDGAVVHGPAARPLPQLPVSFDDQGRLVVAGDYSEPIGG